MKLYQPFRYKLKVAKTPLKGEAGLSSNFRKKRREEKKAKKKARAQRKYQSRMPKKYKVYIKSAFWTERKNAYYRKFGKRCVVCFSSAYVNLHHLIYADFGFEKDENLVPLCSFHHASFHAKVGVKGNMQKETHEFIDDERQLLEFPEF